MKQVLLLISLGFLFSQAEIDTTAKLPVLDFSKGFNIPGIIPKEISIANKLVLFPYEIEAIKQKARNYDPEPVTNDDIVVMETNRGTMKLKLFPDVAPRHCRNFKKLANSGFYNGTAFHRIIPGFMIQGGDINSRDNDPKNDGQGGPGWKVDAEFNDISHKRGILSMARSRDKNSAGSQFFICVADAPHLDRQYTAFGEVIEKMHVADHIVKTPTEYMQAKRMSKESIPDGEDPDNWITLRDQKAGQKLYSKVPQFKKKSDYEYEMRNKIMNSDRPSLPLTIVKLRVIKQSDIQETQAE
jgi:peptidyl-prolyl cis-trans isomerase B (cyclophilin B)